MEHKIEAIDYLRGLSLFAIIIIHVIAWHDTLIITKYSQVPFFFYLRDFLQFSVVTLVVCSGFSLYKSHGKLALKKKDITDFYVKRIKRILLPWWVFLTIFFLVHAVIKILFNRELTDLSGRFILLSFLMAGGIGFGWLIILMLVLSLLFPFLKYWYDYFDRKIIFVIFASAYLLSIFLFNILGRPVVILAVSFVLGWSIVYFVGFLLEGLYNEHPFVKKELQLTFAFAFLFIVIGAAYMHLGLSRMLYLNKYPPSPYYLSFGLMMTFILLTLFFSCKHFIHAHLKRVLSFFSSNSFWLFMWNALTISLITPLMYAIDLRNIYFKLAADVALNIIAVSFLVLLQKKLIKIKMHDEKHHF